MAPSALLLALLAAAAWAPPMRGLAATFVFDFHHRFSDTVRRWAESTDWGVGPAWPEKGSVEYYTTLAEHDRVLRGRGLAGAHSALTFSEGNETYRIGSLGFLHYAFVSVGTPSKDFLVALDTGSDLFWLPCDCKRCAPTSGRTYGPENIVFDIYSPKASSTSKKIPCSSSYCNHKSECSGDSSCPYRVAYVSANTSSSGILVQDVLHLVTDDSLNEIVEAQVVFGCGETQTGSFLNSAAPNGLFGLGMEKISVPSLLSTAGLTSNSFSMCFGSDGIGRISFGDKGSSDQDETALNIHGSHPTYNVTVAGMRVGNSSVVGDFSVVVDSGTSFTYLADPDYTRLTESFNSKIQDERQTFDSSFPFDYCYSPRFNTSLIPTLGLRMEGGSEFPVNLPVIPVATEREEFYCLAVIKSYGLNIIGQNFMTGLQIVFDREKLVLGWKEVNCSDVVDSNTLPVNPRNPGAPSPSISVGPRNYNPEATETRNTTRPTPVLPTSSSSSLTLNSLIQVFSTLLLLSIAIL